MDDFSKAAENMEQLVLQGHSWSGNERNSLFLNVGETRFANAAAVAGFDFKDDTRGLATFDWDCDGDLDVWQSARHPVQVRLLRNHANQVDQANHWIKFALVGDGQHVNRDGIGARVTMTAEPQSESGQPNSWFRTSRAGEGFLSQSSRWVHFGIGQHDSVSVTVRWPNGTTQTFRDLSADSHYRIHYGKPHARIWLAPTTIGADFDESAVTKTPDELDSRTYLVQRPPMPELSMQSISDRSPTTFRPDKSGRSKLITLWASWCVPCRAELAMLQENAAQLAETGLDVIALNVENAESQSDRVLADIEQVVENHSGDLKFAYATQDTIDALQVLANATRIEEKPLGVPYSFLVDSAGHLMAVYEGTVAADQVIRDVQTSDLPLVRRRDYALPFSGRWLQQNVTTNFDQLASRFFRLDRFDYSKKLFEQTPNRQNDVMFQYEYAIGLQNTGNFGQALPIFRSLLSNTKDPVILSRLWNGIGVSLRKTGDPTGATEAYEKAVELDSSNPQAANNLGLAHIRAGRMSKALTFFKRAAKADPSFIDAWNHSGLTKANLRDYEGAEKDYETALGLDPEHFGVLQNYGWLMLNQKKRAAAAKLFRRALEQRPGNASSADGLRRAESG